MIPIINVQILLNSCSYVEKRKRSQVIQAGVKPSKSSQEPAANIELVKVLGMHVLCTFCKVQENID